MITYTKNVEYDFNTGDREKGVKIIEIFCLSTDTKPTADIVTGSIATEVDTGDVYLFDEASTTWNKMCSIKE